MNDKIKCNTTLGSTGKTTYNDNLKIPIYVFFLLGVIAIFLEASQSLFNSNNIYKSNNTFGNSMKFAIFGKKVGEEHLVHVINVLRLFGYERVNLNDTWDLLWAHDYPFFLMTERLQNLRPHQMVNHFPGSGFITNKVELCTSNMFSFLPRAFRLPNQKNDFLSYVKLHPDSLFVEKHNEHRHIYIRSPEIIQLDSNNSFIQEYIQNPFLIDGFKFDIGVYVVITSVNPLRVYIYSEDILFRYCSVKYHPFDPQNVSKYVVGDNYMPTWEVPSLKKYYNLFSGSMKASFDAYIRDKGLNPSKIWVQAEDIIRTTLLAKEKQIIKFLNSYKTDNFFELLRFDFIIDTNLKVHLMEANMSPNLSSAHFKPNSLLYEQLLYSVFNLVGIGTPFRIRKLQASETHEILTADKNLASDVNVCVTNNCDKLCNKIECTLCLPCLSLTEYDMLKKAHREHLHHAAMKRIFPPPIKNLDSFDFDLEVQNMTKRNAWMMRWFFKKCEYDPSWCH